MTSRFSENSQFKKSIRAIGTAWCICSLALLLPLSETTAQIDGTPETRPFFQAPFPCGQKWKVKTYEAHSPDPDSIDLVEFDNNANNTSEGHAVVASASGLADWMPAFSEPQRVIKTFWLRDNELPPSIEPDDLYHYTDIEAANEDGEELYKSLAPEECQ